MYPPVPRQKPLVPAPHPAWKRWCADTAAVVLFFTIVGGLNEYFVAGLTLDDVIRTRIGAVPVLIVTGGLYGCYRDVVLRLTGFACRSTATRVWIDTATCLSFRVPVYGGILLLGGAEGVAFWRGLVGGVVVILFSGRPCGICIDLARRMVGAQQRER